MKLFYRNVLCASILIPYICNAQVDDKSPKKLTDFINYNLRGSGFSVKSDLEFTGLKIDQDIKYDPNNKSQDSYAFLQGNFYLQYKKQVNGMAIGASGGWKIRSGVVKRGRAIFDSAFAFLEHDIAGTFKFGYTKTAADAFLIDGTSVCVGFNTPCSGFTETVYKTSSGSIVDSGFAYDDGRALKFVWLSPTYRGFSAGLSYTLDNRDRNPCKRGKTLKGGEYDPRRSFDSTSDYFKHAITGGLSYERGSPETFYYKLALAFWFAQSKTDGHKDSITKNILAWNLGSIFQYKNWSMSLGYTDFGKSLLSKQFATADIPKDFSDLSVEQMKESVWSDNKDHTKGTQPWIGILKGAHAGKIYSAGLAYNMNKWTYSVGYLHTIQKFSAKEKSYANIYTTALEYQCTPDMKVYFEYNKINTKTCDRAIAYELSSEKNPVAFKNNNGNIYAFGMKINL